MNGTKHLVLALDNESSNLGDNTVQMALGLKKMYKKDSEFKRNLDEFLLDFNGKSENYITIDDIVDLTFDRKLPNEKVELIKQFLEENLNKFNIGVSFKSGAFIRIEGCINDVKNSVMSFTGPINEAEFFLSFVKVIRDFLIELKGKVDSILSDEKFRKVLYFLFSNLCQKGQKEIFKIVCENIKGKEEYKELVYKKDGLEKSDTSILTNFIIGDNNELKIKLTQHLSLIHSGKNKTQKLKDEFLDLFINHLIKNKTLLDGIVDNETWDLSLDIQDEFEGKRGKVKEEKVKKEKIVENEKENGLSAKKMIVNKIHNLTINQQIWFFSNFYYELVKNPGYKGLINRSNKIHISFSKFLGSGYASFYNLLQQKNSKVGKPIINRFIKKVCRDENLCGFTATSLDLNIELFNLLRGELIKKENIFPMLEETERKKMLFIKAGIENLFLGLLNGKKITFLAGIYNKITGENIDITNIQPENVYKLKNVINNFIKGRTGYIIDLFFSKNNKIKPRRFIDKLVSVLCKSKDYSDYCVQFFGLEEEIKNIDEENPDVTIKENTLTNTEPLDWIQKDTGPKDLGKILALARDKDDSLDLDGDKTGINSEGQNPEKLTPINHSLDSEKPINLKDYINGLNALEQREFLIKLFNEAKKIDNLQVMMGRGKTFSLQLKNLFLDGLDLSEEKIKRLKMNLYFLLDKGKDWKLQEETIDLISKFLSKNEILSDAIVIIVETRKDNNQFDKKEKMKPEALSDGLVVEGQINEGEIVKPAEKIIISEQKIVEVVESEPINNKKFYQESDIRGYSRERLPDFAIMGETIIPKLGERREVISTYSSMTLITKQSTYLKLSNFLIAINEIIREKLRENHPKIKSENYKDYEILDGHFNTVLSGKNGFIIQNMFSKLQEGIKKCERWQNITKIISLDDLDNELSIYINKNKIKN